MFAIRICPYVSGGATTQTPASFTPPTIHRVRIGMGAECHDRATLEIRHDDVDPSAPLVERVAARAVIRRATTSC